MQWVYDQGPVPRVYGAMKTRAPIKTIPALTPRQLRHFWEKVSKSEGCWEWTGTKTKSSYGSVWLGWERFYAHRVAYTIAHGAIPDGLTVDHLCHNRRCVNPAHLEAVPLGVNILRSGSPTAKHAAKTHCVHGHPITEPGQYILDSGGRRCLICKREKERRHDERLRAAGVLPPLRPKDTCMRGHLLTLDNVYWSRDHTQRRCRICQIASSRANRAKRKACEVSA